MCANGNVMFDFFICLSRIFHYSKSDLSIDSSKALNWNYSKLHSVCCWKPKIQLTVAFFAVAAGVSNRILVFNGFSLYILQSKFNFSQFSTISSILCPLNRTIRLPSRLSSDKFELINVSTDISSFAGISSTFSPIQHNFNDFFNYFVENHSSTSRSVLGADIDGAPNERSH